MKLFFNRVKRENFIPFNRERLLLVSYQKTEQLYYMLDTQFEGIYPAEAEERKRHYGANDYKRLLSTSKFKFLSDRKAAICSALKILDYQTISVFRQGTYFYSEITSEDLVPGDVLFISKGDIMPADVRIVFSKDLKVDQSIYSGQIQSIKKNADCKNENLFERNITDLPNICLVGSRVIEGLARAVVVSTGRATYLSHLLLI